MRKAEEKTEKYDNKTKMLIKWEMRIEGIIVAQFGMIQKYIKWGRMSCKDRKAQHFYIKTK